MNFKKLLPANCIIIVVLILTFGSLSCDRFQHKNQFKKGKSWKEFTINENGDSLYILWGANGNKKSEVTFKNGMHDGVGYNYYDDGTIKNEIHYSEGYKDGDATWYYESGAIYRHTLYEMGKKVGIRKYYYENGQLKAEIPYESNSPVPGLKEYTESGTLINDYPKLVIWQVDKIAFEDKIVVKAKLKNWKKKVKYSLNMGGIFMELGHFTKKNVLNYEIKVRRGQSIMEKNVIRAQTTSKMGYPLVIEKSYNLVAENIL